jgi:mannose-6-phosphate isomerase-like protein (cupin superfamily)
MYSAKISPLRGGIAFARPLRQQLVNGMNIKTLRFGRGFSICGGNQHSQAATMVIAPGETEGGPDNNHRGADQWLFVVSGRGVAKVGRKRLVLRTSSLLLIERGQTHEIANTGTTDLVTLNFYVPPAYTKAGDELPTAKPG